MNEEFRTMPNMVNLKHHGVCFTRFPDLNIHFSFFIIIYQGKLLLDQKKLINFLFDKGIINLEILLNCKDYEVLL